MINVGTATLGGFIGAGGYGGPILRGIDKFDVPLMLEGAVPAALLALVIEGLFGLVERSVPTPPLTRRAPHSPMSKFGAIVIGSGQAGNPLAQKLADQG